MDWGEKAPVASAWIHSAIDRRKQKNAQAIDGSYQRKEEHNGSKSSYN